jgi:hypothetical protein
MGNIPSVRLSADMSLDAITKEIAKLDGSNGRLQQKIKIKDGVEVVYLRRATAKDSIKNLFMGSAKRKESRESAFKIISTIAKKVGLNEDNLLMKNIKTYLKSGGDMRNTLQMIGMFADASRLGFFEPISSGNSGSVG